MERTENGYPITLLHLCEQQRLRELAASLPAHAVIVELGSYLGGSTVLLAQASPTARVYAVDEWHWAQKQEDADKVFEAFCLNCIEQGVIHRVYPLRCDTVEAAKLFADASVDLLFIDSFHVYEHCKAELTAWLPKVKRGGILCGHDYEPFFPGIQQAVDEALGPPELIRSLWVARPLHFEGGFGHPNTE